MGVFFEYGREYFRCSGGVVHVLVARHGELLPDPQREREHGVRPLPQLERFIVAEGGGVMIGRVQRAHPVPAHGIFHLSAANARAAAAGRRAHARALHAHVTWTSHVTNHAAIMRATFFDMVSISIQALQLRGNTVTA